MTTVNVTIEQGSAYTWISPSITWDAPAASKTWDNLYNTTYLTLVIENIIITVELLKKTLEKLSKETCIITEFIQKTNQKKIFETWTLTELYIDYICFFLRAIENIVLAATIANQAIFIKKENVNINDIKQITTTKKLINTISINELTQKQSTKQIKEMAIITEQPKHQANKKVNNIITITDFSKRDISEKILENISVSEVYWDYIAFILRTIENIIITENQTKSLSVPKKDAFSIVEKVNKTLNKNTLRSIIITDNFNRNVDFKLVLQELIHITEKLAKHLQLSQKEVISLVSEILRHANAVLSDIVLSNGELSFDEFITLDTPAGFEEFKDFISGDLSYQKALVKIILKAGITASKPLITEWKLNIDLPDIHDKGSCSIPASTTFVPFNRQYTQIPEVTVTLKGGSNIVVPKVVNITLTGFYVELKDINNNFVAGTISWLSIGC